MVTEIAAARAAEVQAASRLLDARDVEADALRTLAALVARPAVAERLVGDPLADVANSRLEILWAFGRDAMHRFTDLMRSMAAIDFTHLAYWDLCAALRPAGKLGSWGLDADAERAMRAAHAWFVDEALERVEGWTRNGAE